MEDDGEDLTPFWLQNTTNLRRADPLRHRLSSIFLSSGLVVLLLLATAVIFLAFFIPSFLSLTTQIFRPNNVKKSWDSLNIVLVLLALIFGFLSRNNNDDSRSDEYRPVSTYSDETISRSNPSTPNRWYDYSDRMGYNVAAGRARVGGLRSSSSYPDLREVSSPWVAGDDHWRFSDDTQVDDYNHLRRRHSWKRVDSQVSETKNVYVDTFTTKEIPNTPPPPASPSPPPPPASPPPQAPAPPTLVKQREKRTYQSVAQKERRNKTVDHDEEPKTPITPNTPPPPPPPPSSAVLDSRGKSSKGDRKRHGATKDFLASFYQKRKKKQRQKSVDNFDTLLHQSQAPLHFQPQPSPPPPPPPPPPPSVFQNLFSSKKDKRKRTHSTPTPPPPPSPPLTAARASKPTTQTTTISSHQPSLPIKVTTFSTMEKIPIPPPPPPPPFKIPALKFVVQGDYVRLLSNPSSRSASPDPEDSESSPTSTSSEPHPTTAATDGGFPTSPQLFCPSPDVNTKADTFIAKFRAGLKLEKSNSIKKQELGLSNLGPGPGPNTSPSHL